MDGQSSALLYRPCNRIRLSCCAPLHYYSGVKRNLQTILRSEKAQYSLEQVGFLSIGHPYVVQVHGRNTCHRRQFANHWLSSMYMDHHVMICGHNTHWHRPRIVGCSIDHDIGIHGPFELVVGVVHEIK